jgi:hypothetical protein
MPTFVDQVEEILGDDLATISGYDQEKAWTAWHQLHELVDARRRSPSPLPDKEAGHLRPFDDFTTALGNVSYLLGGERVAAELKRTLLYCHSVVITNPFIDTGLDEFVRGHHKSAVAQRIHIYSDMLRTLRPLIESSVVILTDYEITSGSSLDDGFQELERKVERGMPSTFDATERRRGAFVVAHDVYRLRNQLGVARVESGRVDISLPAKYPSSQHALLLRAADAGDSPSSVESQHLQALARIPVALLDDLPIESVVNIRMKDEDFEDWRRSLRQALREIYRLDFSDEKGFEAATRQVLGDVLDRPMTTLKDRIASSSMLGNAKTAVRDLAIGVLLDVAVGALGAGTVAATGKTVFDALTNLKRQKGNRAALTHFVALTDTAS